MRNVTARRRAEEELRRANADLQQFAYAASHDLQEPLRNVSVYAQLLERRCGARLDQETGQYLRYVVEGALVSDLLAYTRAGSEDDSPEQLTDCGVVLEEVMSGLASAVKESGAELIREPLPTVYVRRGHLQQVLQNLISNALKYRKESEPPRIHVRAEPGEGIWRFSIADNGIGIAPEYHETIFGVFKRLHSSGRKYAGTGIGLAICQKIVERYGGRIWVESAPGRGSVFYFTLPRRGL